MTPVAAAAARCQISSALDKLVLELSTACWRSTVARVAAKRGKLEEVRGSYPPVPFRLVCSSMVAGGERMTQLRVGVALAPIVIHMRLALWRWCVIYVRRLCGSRCQRS